MAYLKSKAVRVMNKFYGEKFSFRKFKMKMVLVSMNLWDIVAGSKKTSPSNTDLKMLKEYQRHIKKAMSIISLNLVDNQFMYIKNCKGSAEA